MTTTEIDHRIPRCTFMEAYKNGAVELLSSYTKDSKDVLSAWVQQVMDETYRPLTGTIIANKNYGSADLVSNVDVIKFFDKNNQRIFSPSGSVYYPASVKKSVMYDFIDHYLVARKIHKKAMLRAEEAGNTLLAQIENYAQSTVKIRVNSVTGGTGSQYSFCYHKPSFNSVTSLSRNMIMNAYAFVERFLIGNFFFPSFDSLLNYIAVIGQKCPSEEVVDAFMRKFELYEPSPDDVFKLFNGYLSMYSNEYDPATLRLLITGIPQHKITFLFYANNFHLLATLNKNVMLKYAKEVFNEDCVDYSDIDTISPKDLFECDGDLLIVLNTHYAKLLGDVSIHDAPKTAPELAKKLVCIARYMQSKVNTLLSIAEFFCNHKTTIDNVAMHKTMYRKVVTNSDTDSVIFTTKDWVEWYTGSYNFTQEAFDIDTLITFLLSKSVEWLMYTMSEQRGATGDDLYAMKMKNEFLYPVLMSCTIPKHYAGPITMREGHVLAKPTFDLKGVSFRGSAMQKVTLDYAENFIKDIIKSIYDPEHPERIGEVDVNAFIKKAIDYEIHILRSLRRGETSYLSVDPVKMRSEYAKPESSIYFNYECWCGVFQDKYGEIQIPTKCHIVPLDPTGMLSESYLNWLNEHHKDIAIKLKAFIAKTDCKKISRMPINPVLNKIPDELIPLVDAKSIAFKNCSPLYLALESLGVSSGISTKKKMLFIDLYGVNEDDVYGEYKEDTNEKEQAA